MKPALKLSPAQAEYLLGMKRRDVMGVMWEEDIFVGVYQGQERTVGVLVKKGYLKVCSVPRDARNGYRFTKRAMTFLEGRS